MVGKFAHFALIAASASYLAMPASAQDGQPMRRLPTLSERLQSIRQDLLGDPADPPRRSGGDNPFSADRKLQGTAVVKEANAPTPARPRTAGRPVIVTPEMQPTQAPIVEQPATAGPPRLQTQAARKAQPGLNAATIEPASSEPGTVAPSIARHRAAEEKPGVPSEDPAPRVAPARATPAEPRVAKSVRQEVIPKTLSEGDRKSRADSKNDDSATGVLFKTQSPVLSVEAAGPKKVLIGKEAVFVVKINNSGAAANEVAVTINIPIYVEVISAQATAGAARAQVASDRRGPMEWKINRLEAQGSETLTLKLVPRKSTPLDLAIRWTFTPESSQTLVEVQEPKLVMAITGPDEVLYGQSKIYKLTVSNPGNGDTENVMVGLEPLGRAAESAAAHRLGTLRAGESKTVDVELTARQAGSIAIKAHAFADGGLRAEAAEQVLVRRANLRVDVESPKVKYAGTVGNYRVKISNAGNAVAENVNLAALLPPEAKYVSSNSGGRFEPQQGKVNWAVGTLQPGTERIFELQCSLSTPGENRMQFVTVAEGDLSAAATSNTRVDALADLKLEVRDPQGPIPVGEDTVYELHIRNRGTKAAENVEIAVFFSDGLEATSVEGGAHEIAPGQVAFKPILTLPAGEVVVYRVHTRAGKSGNHVFRAEVVCASLHTKLSAEEATHFYGDDKGAPVETARQPQPLRESPCELPTEEPAGDSE